jgi:hypothetical protein
MPEFTYTPTGDHKKFIFWAKICLGNKSYKYVYMVNNGQNVLKLGREIKMLKAQIDTVMNYVSLPDEQCLSCEEITDIVRRIKSCCSDC